MNNLRCRPNPLARTLPAASPLPSSASRDTNPQIGFLWSALRTSGLQEQLAFLWQCSGLQALHEHGEHPPKASPFAPDALLVDNCSQRNRVRKEEPAPVITAPPTPPRAVTFSNGIRYTRHAHEKTNWQVTPGRSAGETGTGTASCSTCASRCRGGDTGEQTRAYASSRHIRTHVYIYKVGMYTHTFLNSAGPSKYSKSFLQGK